MIKEIKQQWHVYVFICFASVQYIILEEIVPAHETNSTQSLLKLFDSSLLSPLKTLLVRGCRFRSSFVHWNWTELPGGGKHVDGQVFTVHRPNFVRHPVIYLRTIQTLTQTPLRATQVMTFHLSLRPTIYIPITQKPWTIPRGLHRPNRKVAWSWQPSKDTTPNGPKMVQMTKWANLFILFINI